MAGAPMLLNRTLPPDANGRGLAEAADQLVAAGRLEEALAAYLSIVEAGGASTRTMLRIGDIHRKLGRHGEAVAAYALVADRYEQDGAGDKAITVYHHIRAIVAERPHELAGEHARLVLRLGELCRTLGRTVEALASYDDVVGWLVDRHREREALEVLERMLALRDHPSTRLKMAECHARLGEIDRAVQCSGQAATHLLEMGRVDEALAVLGRMLASWPEPSFARMAARLHLERGRKGDAVEALSKLQLCVRAWPDDIGTLELLASAFDAAGEPDKASRVLEEATRIAKKKGDTVSAARLVAERRQRDPDLEDSILEKVVLEEEITDALRRRESAPSTGIDEDALWLAEELASSGRFELARTLVRSQLAVRPDHPLVQQVESQIESIAQSFPSSPPPSLAGALEGPSYPPPAPYLPRFESFDGSDGEADDDR